MLGRMHYGTYYQGLPSWRATDVSYPFDKDSYGATDQPYFHHKYISTYEDSEDEGPVPKSAFVPGRRRVINMLAIVANIVIPSCVFSILLALWTFKIHYNHPWVPVTASLLSGLGCLAPGIYGVKKVRGEERNPMWYRFACAALFLAIVTSFAVGQYIFWSHSWFYYDYFTLRTETMASPVTEKGQMMMDSGRVYWSSGTVVDTKLAMGFKHKDVYCVAPIVDRGVPKLSTYDFWVVGKNCCEESRKFDCGDARNPSARASLRDIDEESRPFYRLAVQQAEAAYNLKASHPVFFHWMVDPTHEIDQHGRTMMSMFACCSVVWVSFNFFCVMCATIAFAKMGRL